MKNVIIFVAAGGRHAVELRWVRDVIALGFVTDVPLAPSVVAGIVNHRGALLPVLGPHALDAAATDTAARQGDGAIVLEVEELLAALRIDNVDEVCTVMDGPTPASVIDTKGAEVSLIDPEGILRDARTAVEGTRLEPAEGTARA